MSNSAFRHSPQDISHLGPAPPHIINRNSSRVANIFGEERRREEKARAVPCVEVVEHFRGPPTSTGSKDWRWGSHGSLSVSLEKNCWFDHEAIDGGDTIGFVERELSFSRETAISWLVDSESHFDPAAAAKPSAHRPPQRMGRIVVMHDYLSETGALLFQVVRYDTKAFRQRSPDGRGGWSWSVRGVSQVPYRLPELMQAVVEKRTILIVEGEKDVDNLCKHGIAATCNAGGAGRWRPEHSRYLRGADVVLVPDNDHAGRDHMNKVGSALTGIVARIRLLELPDLLGDVSDWLANGGTVEMLSELIAKAPPWKLRAPFLLVERTAESMRTSSVRAETKHRQEHPGSHQDQQHHANAQETEQEQTSQEDESPSDSGEQTSRQEETRREHENTRNTDEAALIDELARLDFISYAKRRKEAAKQLGIRVAALDEAVKQRRRELEQEQRKAAEKANRKKDPIGRRGFVTDERGLWWRDQSGDGSAHHLAGPFDVRAVTRDAHSNSWGVLMGWKDQDAQNHRWVMPRSMLAGDPSEVFRNFLDGGLLISPNRQHREKLIEYLMLCNPAARARCVERTGWYGEMTKSRFVLPNGEVIGPGEGEEIALQTASPLRGPAIAGDLTGWKTAIAARCVGNSRLLTAISMSFVGPLLVPLGEESFGLHFKGKSSTGKTGLLHLAASTWGTEIRTWRTTDNSAESWCAAANDGLLPLDEISQGDGRSVYALAYMLAAGTGKGRANRSGIARPVATWRIVFISTGEIGLAEKLAEAGRRVQAGQLVRVIEIPAEANAGLGVFENLHGLATGAAFANTLREETAQHTGHAARVFIAGIAGRVPELIAAVKKDRINWIQDHVPDEADGEVQRVAAKFALDRQRRRISAYYS
jgi:uncharacterized protein (DUF927 family)